MRCDLKRAPGRPRRHGFTLIELLVVVAVVALLISLLLPSLNAAREKGKQARCVANLKQVGGAMCMYFGEHNDWYPFEKRNWPMTGKPSAVAAPMSAFHYGGHPGRPPGLTFAQNMRDSFRGRPFNPYLYEHLLDRVEDNGEVNTPEFEERRKSMALYQCPSDTGALFNTEKIADNGAVVPAHHHNGASYDINYHFVWMWAAGQKLGAPHKPYGAPRTLYLERANRFLKHQRDRHAARFVVNYEDVFDSALYLGVRRIGYHRQLNRFSLLFLDAHAGNVLADASQGTHGAGWKTSSGEWYHDPNDPDYPLRDLMKDAK